MNKKISIIFWILITLIPIAGVIFSLSDPQSFELAKKEYQEQITSFGTFAPLVFVLVQAIQVVVTPISHYSVGVVGGFLFGPFFGAFLNWIGRMIGHTIAFFIARKFARPFAQRFVNKETIDKYDKFVSEKTTMLFLIYFLPLFPDDEVSYLAGLSKMEKKKFFIANFFGHIGGSLGLAYLGSGLDTKDPIFWVLFILSILGFIIFYFLMKKGTKTKS